MSESVYKFKTSKSKCGRSVEKSAASLAYEHKASKSRFDFERRSETSLKF